MQTIAKNRASSFITTSVSTSDVSIRPFLRCITFETNLLSQIFASRQVQGENNGRPVTETDIFKSCHVEHFQKRSSVNAADTVCSVDVNVQGPNVFLKMCKFIVIYGHGN